MHRARLLKPLLSLAQGVASSLLYAADLALPPICIACGALLDRHGVLCPACWSGVNFIRPPLCDRLGLPLPFDAGGVMISAAALASPPEYGRARAAAHYDGVMRNLIHALKYNDRHEGLGFFGKLLQEAGRGLLAEAEVIVPAPLYRLRLVSRRFNQSALLAKQLARETGLPAELMALQRVKRTQSQVGLTLDQRKRNVAGAFRVKEGHKDKIAGRRVLLIDDVITTGATADACARTLKRAGAAGVDVLALALVAGDALHP